MLQVAEFWVALAFIIFVAIAFKPARKAILSMLDDRAERIRGELEEAQRLREEAQSLLAGYQRRQRDALKEAEAIVAHAREEAERLRASAAAELESSMRRREAQAMDKIAQAETAAVQEVRNLTVDIAISASGQILAQRLDDGQSARLVDEAIKDLPKHLH
jgi:F-type H+-transporting ATPase subunit b